jgi:hypothetical protein
MIFAVPPEFNGFFCYFHNLHNYHRSEMTGRNLAKPFAIAGFILAEIYMLFTVLAPYGHETHELPLPIPETSTLAPGTPVPLSAKLFRVGICAIFFGPFGAVVGGGIGLLASGLLGDFSQKPSISPKNDQSPPQ